MAMQGWFKRIFRRTSPQSGANTASGNAPAAPTPPAQSAAAPQPATPPITPAPPSASSRVPELPKNPWEAVERALIWTIPAILLITLILTFALVAQLFRGAERADEKTLIVGATALFVCVALVFLTRLIRSLEDGQQLGVESHWGGLGGGVGGWRISMPVAYFIGVASFAALAAVAVSNYPKARAEPTATPSATGTTGSAATKETKSTTATTSTTGTTVTQPVSATTATGTAAATSTKAP